MPAKNKKRSAAPKNIHAALAAHVEANRLAHEWATKCIALRDAGKAAPAKAAEAKARYWLAKTLVLEAQAGDGKPSGGRMRRRVVRSSNPGLGALNRPARVFGF